MNEKTQQKKKKKKKIDIKTMYGGVLYRYLWVKWITKKNHLTSFKRKSEGSR
jgi:hypothetical protein